MLPGVESLDIDPLRAQFAAGKIGMYFNHSGEPAVYQSQFPTKVNWSAALPPRSMAANKGPYLLLPGTISVSVKAQRTKIKLGNSCNTFTI